MSLELYSQDSIFNAGVTAVRSIVQLEDPVHDYELATKYYVDQTIAIIQSTPLVLPIATGSILGGVKIGVGLTIEHDGRLNVTDGPTMKTLRDWIDVNGINVAAAASWVMDESANVVMTDILNGRFDDLVGGAPAQQYNTIEKISRALERDQTDIDSFQAPITWVLSNSASLHITNTNTIIGKNNTLQPNSFNTIIVGSNSVNTDEYGAGAYDDCIILGTNATAHGHGRFCIGSNSNPLETSTTASSGDNLDVVDIPLKPQGYLHLEINGKPVKIPYYNA